MLSCLTNAALNQSACEEEILSYNSCMKKAIVSIPSVAAGSELFR
jgi:hypothetical protein